MTDTSVLPANRLLPWLYGRPTVLKLFAFFIPILALFYQDLGLIGTFALNSDLYNYIFFIPVFILYFLYSKRHTIAALITNEGDESHRLRDAVLGGSLLFLAFVVYQFGSTTTYAPDLHVASLQIFIAGEVALIFNAKLLRVLAFPILLICGAYLSVGQYALGFWTEIASSSAWLSAAVLSALHYQVSSPQTITGLGTVIYVGAASTPFEIGLASSGLYSLLGFCLFLAFITYYTKGSVVRRLLIVVLGFPLLYFVNVARIVIVVAAELQWGNPGYQITHLTGGILLVFIATLILLFVSERFLHLRVFPSSRATPDCSQCGQSRSRRDLVCKNCGKLLYLRKGILSRRHVVLILVLLVVSVVFLYSLVPAFPAATSPVQTDPRLMSPSQAINMLPIQNLNRSGWILNYAFRDNATQYLLEAQGGGESAVFSYAFENNVTNAPLNVVVEISPGPPHRWETSVIAATIRAPLGSTKGIPSIYVDSDTTIPTKQPIVGRYFVYLWQNGPAGNNTVAVLYWIVQASFPFGGGTQVMNVEITLYSQYLPTYASDRYILSQTDYAGLEVMFTSLAQQIASAWNPKSGVSSLQVGVNKETVPLLIIGFIPSIIAMGLWLNEDLKAKGRAARAYEGLTKQEKDLVKSVAVVSLNEKPTTANISYHWALSKEGEIPPEGIGGMLSEAESKGLVGRKISEVDGEPVEVWVNKVPF